MLKSVKNYIIVILITIGFLGLMRWNAINKAKQGDKISLSLNG